VATHAMSVLEGSGGGVFVCMCMCSESLRSR